MQTFTSALERLAWGTDAGFYRILPEEVLMPADEAAVQAILARASKASCPSEGCT